MEQLTGPQQDYLEAIYQIIVEKSGVRVKDIAKRLDVKNSSVVSALHSLAAGGYINYEPYGIISLTPKGSNAARLITEKHRVLRHFFEQVLGVNRSVADESACRVEHAMVGEVFSRFTQFVKYVYMTHKKDPDWLNGFREFYLKEELDPECRSCIEDFFDDVEDIEVS